MSKIKRISKRLLFLACLAGFLPASTVFATGTATMSITPASGSYTVGNTISVVVNENSGSVGINTVEADLSYNASQLQYVSSAMSSSFDTSVQNSGGSGLTCFVAAKFSTPLTNSQPLKR